MLVTSIASLDWINLIAGALLSLVSALIAWFIKGLYEYYISAKDLPYPIWGFWYSAEYDSKSEIPDLERNYYLKINIKRRLYRKVKIEVVEDMNDGGLKVETKWVVKAKIVQGDVLIGTWKSTVKNTNRYGTIILKFLDSGRATGYYTGTSKYPVYGYWIITRDFEDLKEICTELLKETHFKNIDVSQFVSKYKYRTN